MDCTKQWIIKMNLNDLQKTRSYAIDQKPLHLVRLGRDIEAQTVRLL